MIKLDLDETAETTDQTESHRNQYLQSTSMTVPSTVAQPQMVPIMSSPATNSAIPFVFKPVINHVVQSQPLLDSTLLALQGSLNKVLTPQQKAIRQRYLAGKSKNTKLKSLIRQLKLENNDLKTQNDKYKVLLK